MTHHEFTIWAQRVYTQATHYADEIRRVRNTAGMSAPEGNDNPDFWGRKVTEPLASAELHLRHFSGYVSDAMAMADYHGEGRREG